MSALANQTSVLRNCVSQIQGGAAPSTNATRATCSNGAVVTMLYQSIHQLIGAALKFITHFTGDITQPLHASGIAIGGNDFDVVYGNRTTNLHSVRSPASILEDPTNHPRSGMERFYTQQQVSQASPTAQYHRTSPLSARES